MSPTAATGPAATRSEHAAHAEGNGLPAASSVAAAVDAVVFGPADPDAAAAAEVWALVATARRAAIVAAAWRRRAWVAVNPASLWAHRAALEWRPRQKVDRNRARRHGRPRLRPQRPLGASR